MGCPSNFLNTKPDLLSFNQPNINPNFRLQPKFSMSNSRSFRARNPPPADNVLARRGHIANSSPTPRLSNG